MADSIRLFASDSGVVLETTLLFADFDPTGAVVFLYVPGRSPITMSLVPKGSGWVANYMVRAGDFRVGRHDAHVRVVKGDVVLNSELFNLIVGR
jgi:hypothetical protein